MGSKESEETITENTIETTIEKKESISSRLHVNDRIPDKTPLYRYKTKHHGILTFTEKEMALIRKLEVKRINSFEDALIYLDTAYSDKEVTNPKGLIYRFIEREYEEGDYTAYGYELAEYG